ncbi:22056_t:CDS:1, partial [Racocetra persica]
QDKIDEFRTVVLDERYAFRVYVGAVEGKFANGAYKSAERSGGGILITVYNIICRDLVKFIVERFYEHIRVLENRNKLFILDYN